jgi:DNA-binding MarR family transcriptional regulator
VSIEAVKMAFKQEGLTSSEKNVLLHLAYHHNDMTNECTKSMAEISSECGMTQKNVMRMIKSLEVKGIIVRIKNGAGRKNSYTIYGSNPESVDRVSLNAVNTMPCLAVNPNQSNAG